MSEHEKPHCHSAKEPAPSTGSCCAHKSDDQPAASKESMNESACESHAAKPASCCAPKKEEISDDHCCAPVPNKIDWLLWGSVIGVFVFYSLSYTGLEHEHWLGSFSHSVRDLMHVMWWGLALGILMVGLLSQIPQDFVLSVLGKGGTKTGLLRATAAGVFLDLCSHGILMVGMELRRKGASLGQVMAFLIASPWNSLSLTLIMIALIGLPWTLAFIGLSMLIGLTAGWIFDRLEENGTLPSNPNQPEFDESFKFWPEAKRQLAEVQWNTELAKRIAKGGMNGARIILKWLLFGVLLASAIRAFVSLEDFQAYFGPTLFGLIATLVAATIIEVCSEGSTPIAADLMTRANAPGNSFAFLMGGVATDYTEILVIKETTNSWKTALFLPLLTLPQVFVVAWLLNAFG
jgi:uncharacterized membrane protein YraQ (UPF0718 family)